MPRPASAQDRGVPDAPRAAASAEASAAPWRPGAAGSPPEGSLAVECRLASRIFHPRSGAEPVTALQDVSLRVPEGSFVSIAGPSGCGKSTLLAAVAGLLPLTTGEIRVAGEPVDGPGAATGLMFQDALLMPWRTALDHALLPVQIAGRPREEDVRRAREVLVRVGLAGFERAYPHELSGGMQQRVALARTLMADPAVLLLDEPFGALDELNRERMNLQLLELWHETGKTIVFVTHNVQEAVFLSDRVVVMGSNPGRVVTEVPVPLPRPRTIEVLRDPAYMETVFEVRGALGVQR